MKLNQQGYAALLVIVILVVVGGAGFYLYKTSDVKKPVTSFEECAAAGNPIQESYPEVCVSEDGRHFPNPTQSAQQP